MFKLSAASSASSLFFREPAMSSCKPKASLSPSLRGEVLFQDCRGERWDNTNSILGMVVDFFSGVMNICLGGGRGAH